MTDSVPDWKLHNSVMSSPPHSASPYHLSLMMSKLPQLLMLPKFVIPTHFFTQTVPFDSHTKPQRYVYDEYKYPYPTTDHIFLTSLYQLYDNFY